MKNKRKSREKCSDKQIYFQVFLKLMKLFQKDILRRIKKKFDTCRLSKEKDNFNAIEIGL